MSRTRSSHVRRYRKTRPRTEVVYVTSGFWILARLHGSISIFREPFQHSEFIGLRLMLSVINIFHLAVSADTSNVKFTETSPAESSSGPTTSANEVSSTQQAVRRSPNIIDSGVQRIPNKVPTDRPRTRIPSTWITSSTTTTTPRSTSTRAPLRTSYPTVRAPTVRSPPATYRPVSEMSLSSSRVDSSSSTPTDALIFWFLFRSFSSPNSSLSRRFWSTISSHRDPTDPSPAPSTKSSTRPSRLWMASLECFVRRSKLSLARDNWLTSPRTSTYMSD